MQGGDRGERAGLNGVWGELTSGVRGGDIEGVTDEVITAAEANRPLSRLFGAVRAGTSSMVISHGKPVARIVPVSSGNGGGADIDGPTPEQLAAPDELIARLKAQPIIDIGPWSCDELYER